MAITIYPVLGKQIDVPFYLSGIGISTPEDHVKREKGLTSHQFLFTKSGTGKLIVEEETYIQKPGSIFYHPPELPHEYFRTKEEWETYWLVFRGENISEIMSKLGFKTFLTNSILPSELPINIFNRILSAAKDPILGNEKTSLLLYEYILACRRLFLSPNFHYGSENVLEKTIIYINTNFAQDITLQQLSDIANVSLQHFCRIFKAHMGMRPVEYLTRRRISEAKALLETTNKSITEIGKLAGYDDSNYFGIVFKKYEGISPSVYRSTR